MTYKVRPDTPALATQVNSLGGAPLDIAVDEISAGGVTEKHDELTDQVRKNITTAFSGHHAITLAPVAGGLESPEATAELGEVQALLRRITLNDAMPLGMPVQSRGTDGTPLSYAVGRIDRVADALNADAVLFVFVRDQYSTGGRKAVMALTMLAGAAAGVAIMPQMGATASSAALVARDGTVIWFNNLGAAGLDLRTEANAASWVKRLMAGFPALPKVAAPAPRGIEGLPAR